MKILDSYKTIAKELIKESAWDRKFGQPLPTLQDVMNEAEVDDDKVIKYKKKDGEQGEMKASSAKSMEKDHPAKIAYDKMVGDDSGEKEKGKDLGAGDFERPGTDDDYTDDDEKASEKFTDLMADSGVDEMIDQYEEIAENPQAALDALKPFRDAGMKVGDVEEKIKKFERFKSMDDEEKDELAYDISTDFERMKDDLADTMIWNRSEPKDKPEDEPESELEKLDKQIKSTEATMNMYQFDYSDSRNQDMANDLSQKLRKLRADREKLVAGSDKNETKVINGVKYKSIKESKKHPLKETYKRIGGK